VYLPPPLLLLLGAAWLTNGGRNWPPYSGRNGVTQTFVRRALDATRGQRRKGGRTAQCYFRSRRRSEGKVRVVFVYRNPSSLRNDCRRYGDV